MSFLKKLFGDKTKPENAEVKKAEGEKDTEIKPDSQAAGEKPDGGDDNYWSNMLSEMVDEAGFGTEVD